MEASGTSSVPQDRDGVAGNGDVLDGAAGTAAPAALTAEVPPDVMEKLTAAIPLRRMGRPEEVARVVRFLAEDSAGYITGQVWGVNGGLDM